MSSGDFEANLRQSVEDHLALVRSAATAAKARIGQSVPEAMTPTARVAEPSPFREKPRAAVDFFAEEPMPEPVYEPVAEPLPEGSIAFDDFGGGSVDDDGIPVWEDPP